MARKMSMAALVELVDRSGKQQEDAHIRLRKDLAIVEDRLRLIEASQTATTLRLERLALTPVNAEAVTFSGKQIAGIVAACLVLAGGMWQIKSSVDDVMVSVESAAKLQDERNEATKEGLAELRRNLEMRRVEIQNLSNFVQQQGAK